MSSINKTNFRIMLLLISLIMFVVQFRIAMMNLLHPPEVDSTTNMNINDVELPLITVCPTRQENLTNLSFYGYTSRLAILKGSTTYNKTSWGQYHNLSFDVLLENIYDKEIAKEISVYNNNKKFSGEILFIPRYGFCKIISDYSAQHKLFIQPPKRHQRMRLFLTDRNFKSFFSPDYSSHKGDAVLIYHGDQFTYDVDLHVSSSCKVSTKQVVMSKDDFMECVDNEIHNTIGKLINCVPPWMSAKNHCTETYDLAFPENVIPDFYEKYVVPVHELEKIEMEKNCRKYCSTLTSALTFRVRFTNRSRSLVTLSFNSNVIVTEKLFSYSPFQFIIDIGSSLGLWMGLSVLGLYDLAIQGMDTLQSFGICKYARSIFNR